MMDEDPLPVMMMDIEEDIPLSKNNPPISSKLMDIRSLLETPDITSSLEQSIDQKNIDTQHRTEINNIEVEQFSKNWDLNDKVGALLREQSDPENPDAGACRVLELARTVDPTLLKHLEVDEVLDVFEATALLFKEKGDSLEHWPDEDAGDALDLLQGFCKPE